MANQPLNSDESLVKQHASGRPSGKTLLENADIVFKIAIGVATAAIAFFTYQNNRVNQAVSLDIAELNARVGAEKMNQETIRDAYDRVDRYLALEQDFPTRGRAIVIYLNKIPDAEVSRALQAVLAEQANSFVVQNAALAAALENATPATSSALPSFTLDNFRDGLVFGEGATDKTDVTVYACQDPGDAPATLDAAIKLGTVLASSGNFGTVRGSYWRNFDNLPARVGAVTMVVDVDHPESGEIENLTAIIRTSLPDSPAVVEANPGQPSRWSISLITCE